MMLTSKKILYIQWKVEKERMRVDEKCYSNSSQHTHMTSKREDKGRNKEISGGYDKFLAPHAKSLESTAPF